MILENSNSDFKEKYDLFANDPDYEEDLSDINEEEIKHFILSPEESAMKSIIWHNMHREWLEEQTNKKKCLNEKKTTTKKRKKKDE